MVGCLFFSSHTVLCLFVCLSQRSSRGSKRTVSVFTEKTIATLEPALRNIGFALSRQSGPSDPTKKHVTMPKTYRRHGYIANKNKGTKERTALKMSGQEMPGLMLVHLVSLLSEQPDCKKLQDEYMAEEDLRAYIKLFNHLLLLDQWMKSDDIMAPELVSASQYIPAFMEFYKETINRIVGHQLKLRKFHYLRHLVTDIIILGVPRNYTGEVPEKNFKYTKGSARRTQKQAHTLDKQTAMRTAEATVVARAYGEITHGMNDSEGFFWGRKGNGPDTNRVGAKVRVTFCSSTDTCRFKILGNSYKRPLCDLWNSLDLSFTVFEDILIELFQELPPTADVIIQTEVVREDFRFHAHPFSPSGRAWQDWAYVKGSRGRVPIHLLLYLNISGLPAEGVRFGNETSFSFLPEGNSIIYNDTYALAQRIYEDPFGKVSKIQYGSGVLGGSYLVDENCGIVAWGCKMAKGWDKRPPGPARVKEWVEKRKKETPFLFLIPVAEIDSPCIAIRDDDGCRAPHNWLFVLPRNEWRNLFPDAMKELISAEKQISRRGRKRKRSQTRHTTVGVRLNDEEDEEEEDSSSDEEDASGSNESESESENESTSGSDDATDSNSDRSESPRRE